MNQSRLFWFQWQWVQKLLGRYGFRNYRGVLRGSENYYLLMIAYRSFRRLFFEVLKLYLLLLSKSLVAARSWCSHIRFKIASPVLDWWGFPKGPRRLRIGSWKLLYFSGEVWYWERDFLDPWRNWCLCQWYDWCFVVLKCWIGSLICHCHWVCLVHLLYSLNVGSRL